MYLIYTLENVADDVSFDHSQEENTDSSDDDVILLQLTYYQEILTAKST